MYLLYFLISRLDLLFIRPFVMLMGVPICALENWHTRAIINK